MGLSNRWPSDHLAGYSSQDKAKTNKQGLRTAGKTSTGRGGGPQRKASGKLFTRPHRDFGPACRLIFRATQALLDGTVSSSRGEGNGARMAPACFSSESAGASGHAWGTPEIFVSSKVVHDCGLLMCDIVRESLAFSKKYEQAGMTDARMPLTCPTAL